MEQLIRKRPKKPPYIQPPIPTERNHTGQFQSQKYLKNEDEGAAKKNIIERKFCVFKENFSMATTQRCC